jgi:hypothetical protein
MAPPSGMNLLMLSIQKTALLSFLASATFAF